VSKRLSALAKHARHICRSAFAMTSEIGHDSSVNDGSIDASVPPRRFRNPNFLRAGLEWLLPAAVFLFVVVAAPATAKWLPAVPFAAALTLSVFYIVSWWRATLAASPEGVVIGGIYGQRHIRWDEIARFEIRDPHKRTPFMLSFAWWIDQAKVVLRDGRSARIRAVEP
jgi:Bacterial PH domain